MIGRGPDSAYERTFLGIAILVAVLWAAATAIQVAFPSHVVPESLNIIMGTVATAFFGGALVSSSRRRPPFEEEPPPPRRRPRPRVTPRPEEDEA